MYFTNPMFKKIAVSVKASPHMNYETIFRFLESYPGARRHKERAVGFQLESDSVVIDNLVFTALETLSKRDYSYNQSVVFLPIYNDAIDDFNYDSYRNIWIGNKVDSINGSIAGKMSPVIVLVGDSRIPGQMIEPVFQRLKQELGKSLGSENILLVRNGSPLELVRQLNSLLFVTMAQWSNYYTDACL